MVIEKKRRMKRRTKLIIAVAASVLAIGSFAAYKGVQHRRRNAALGAIYEIKAAILSEVRKDHHELWEINVPADGHWYILQTRTYDGLITKLSKHHDLKAAKNWNCSRLLLDPWGNRFRIMFRRQPGETWAISILSNGPDGLEQTVDDLARTSTYPYPGVDLSDPNLKWFGFVPGFDRYPLVESDSQPR